MAHITDLKEGYSLLCLLAMLPWQQDLADPPTLALAKSIPNDKKLLPSPKPARYVIIIVWIQHLAGVAHISCNGQASAVAYFLACSGRFNNGATIARLGTRHLRTYLARLSWYPVR